MRKDFSTRSIAFYSTKMSSNEGYDLFRFQSIADSLNSSVNYAAFDRQRTYYRPSVARTTNRVARGVE